MAPKQTDPQFKIRLTPDLKAAIEKAAAKNNRSMNAEILARLETSFITLDGNPSWENLREFMETVREARDDLRAIKIEIEANRTAVKRSGG